MKTILKIAAVVSALVLLAPEADAVLGVRRRTAVVVGASVAAADSAKVAGSQQQAAAAQQEAATARQEATAAKQQAAAAVAPPPAAVAAGTPLPIGTVVSALPPGCVSTPVGGVEYYYGGGNFYRAVFQGNNLVYVTAKPQ
jgi:hypothetical protein